MEEEVVKICPICKNKTYEFCIHLNSERKWIKGYWCHMCDYSSSEDIKNTFKATGVR